ncbi:GRF1-interacting factor 1 isoform X2 [Lactuca sativa]|uniref:GRF1-interacting factor 1 isoform X2 n=1 Tax=Lactuca sativa TaxID=4236 RepID=UPI000CD836E2|nr:GRF1-interacting factor 1 isoform X2 [Lactuca sativa]
MQHQLMHQMQHRPTPTPTGAFNTTTITTDHIQQYLDENKALILNILENQSTGKFSECAENQTRLQHNLMYLAAIADCQPKSSSTQLQQLQQMVPNSHMLTQSHTVFPQQPPFTMIQQQQQHVLQSQLGIQAPRSGSGTSMEGQGCGVFPDFSFGEVASSHGVRTATFLTAKDNRGIAGSASSHDTHEHEGSHDFPQKKGKLTTTT